MKHKLVLFDFDGTIADTFPVLISILNRLAPWYRFRKISPADFRTIRNERFRSIAKYLGISLVALPFLLKAIRSELVDHDQEIVLFPGMKQILHSASKKHALGIVTRNNEEVILPYLKRNHVDHFFSSVKSVPFYATKTRYIKQVIRQLGFDKKNVIYVGDEIDDIFAAKSAQIKIISVTWGLQSSEYLATADPDYLVDEPEALHAILESL